MLNAFILPSDPSIAAASIQSSRHQSGRPLQKIGTLTHLNQVEAAFQLMSEQINIDGIALVLGRYADDFYVHDRARLELLQAPGMQFMWSVGDYHSHLYPLGIHERDQKMASPLSRQSRDDHYYLINFSRVGQVSIQGVTRLSFSNLVQNKLEYCTSSTQDKLFWTVYRGESAVQQQAIGNISLISAGHNKGPGYKLRVSANSNNSPKDNSALRIYAEHAAVIASGTLFVRYYFDWQE